VERLVSDAETLRRQLAAGGEKSEQSTRDEAHTVDSSLL